MCPILFAEGGPWTKQMNWLLPWSLHSADGTSILFVGWLLQIRAWKELGLTECLATANSLQSCPTLCDPIDGSPPGSPVPGILQARTLEWVAISFSNASKWKVKVKSLSCVQLFATPWTAVCQASLSITNSQSPPKPMSIELVIPSNHPILHRPLLLLPSIFPSIRVFSNESALCIRWPKYWSFSFNISPSKEYQDWSPLGWTG